MAAAARLLTLCAAPSTCPLLSSPRSRQTNSMPATATARRNPARPVKATTRPQEAAAARDGGTELSAWTSVRQERWEGELPVQGHLPDWLVRYNSHSAGNNAFSIRSRAYT